MGITALGVMSHQPQDNLIDLFAVLMSSVSVKQKQKTKKKANRKKLKLGEL